MLGLEQLLSRNVNVSTEGRDEFFAMGEGYFSPGHWVAYTARARSRNLDLEVLGIPKTTFEYARALGIEKALGLDDTYPYERKNKGQHYSPLVVLDSADQIDPATTCIGGCIRELFAQKELAAFVGSLCDVVGDLHDNVWSHGKSTGISMAQRWRDPKYKDQFRFEFALADCGLGFQRELRRAGVAQREGITDDFGSIRWCVQEGNTSKPPPTDEWVQRLPEEHMAHGRRPPMTVRHDEGVNHHMGLGLAKLVRLVTNYGGQLWLASGEAMLTINPDGTHTYQQSLIQWDGVAMACRFQTGTVLGRSEQLQAHDEVDALLEQIVGGVP